MIDMSVAGNMNGVTRCIDVLMDAFSKDLSFNPTWLRFMPMDDAKMVIKRARGIRIILFPLPKDIFHFLNDDEKRKEYWNYAYSLLSTYISEYTILHIHTLNLAEFALIVNRKLDVGLSLTSIVFHGKESIITILNGLINYIINIM